MSRRAERQARRAARRAQRQANKETRQNFRKDKLAARSDRQKQRQGFLAGLAPQILDKIPVGATNSDTIDTGGDYSKQGEAAPGSGAGGGMSGLASGGMMLPLLILGAVLLMKKK